MHSKLIKLISAAAGVVVTILAAIAWVSMPAPVQQVQAGDLGGTFRDNLINQTFRGVAYAPPATTYVGLASTPCGTNTYGTEPSGGGYTRTAVVSSTATWTAPAGGTISNVSAITFTPTATWGTITHYFQATSLATTVTTSDYVLTCKALGTAKYVNAGDSLSFPPGALTFGLQ